MTNLKVGWLQLNLERFENFPYIKNKINSSLKEHKEMGLIVRPILDTIALCPPLVISEKEIDELSEEQMNILNNLF